MCTPEIVQVASVLGAERSLKGKSLIGQDIFPKLKPAEVKPLPDESVKTRLEKQKELIRQTKGRPGRGRAGTIRPGTTGTTVGGAPATTALLKSRTGQ